MCRRENGALLLVLADFVTGRAADYEARDRSGKVAGQSRSRQAARERAGDSSDLGIGCIRHTRAERQA